MVKRRLRSSSAASTAGTRMEVEPGSNRFVQVLTRQQLIDLLRAYQGARSQKAFAEELGCSTAYLCDIYAGNRDPGPKVLEAIGLKEEKIYRRWR